MPFAGYKDFKDCVNKNQDKGDPEAYCGKIKHQVEDTYVQGYFKPQIKTPNVNCMQRQIIKILELDPERDINLALENAYQFCISESDFKDEIIKNPRLYPLLYNISLLLKNSKQDFYILDDAEVMSTVTPGVSHRIEPMKTLAEASTSGKKTSSNIKKVGYFNNILEVEFNSGERYMYFVEPDLYDKFVAADSKGKFLWENLRGHDIGLVWGYATGTGSKMKYTPGGVGASLVPYAKGSAGTPEYEPRLPTEKERELVKKEIGIQFLGQGLKFKEPDQGLQRQSTIEEIRTMFGGKKIPSGKTSKYPSNLAPHERYIDFEVKEDSMDALINWVEKEIGAKGDEAIGIAFAISKSRKKKKEPENKKKEKTLKELEVLHKEISKRLKERNISIGKHSEREKIRKEIESEKDWKDIWESQVSKFDQYKEASKRYKEHKKGMESYHQHVYYGTLDFIGIPLKEDYCGTIEDFGVCKKRYELLYDFYHMEDEKERNKLQKTMDKYNINKLDDTSLEGVITRAGAFKYGDKIVHKDWNNLLENAMNHPILPVFGSKHTNPHKEENETHLIGYVDSWNPDYNNKELRGTIHTFEPIESISDLDNPENIQVSLSMFDDAPEDSNIQHIIGFRNVAIALNNQIQGRCESVDGYGSCMVNPTEDMNHANNLSQIIIQKPGNKINTRSSSSEKNPSKIITQKNDLQMTDENEKVKNDIAKFIAEYKKTDDNLAISTGNEVEGFTLYDKFKKNMLDEGFSPSAIEVAWRKFNAQNNPTDESSVDVSTQGFVKHPPSMTGDFEERFNSLMEVVEKQSEQIKKYDDFFQAKQKEVENNLKAKYKKPFSEENQELIEKLDFDSLETIQPIMDMLIKEHPEIMPTDKGAEEIADMNTNEILKALGKEKENLRKVKDDALKMKNDAEEKMKNIWSKKSE